jgi:uncharacterized phage protein (TIGR01671 family)
MENLQNRIIKFRAWDKTNKNMLYDVATGVITIWDYAKLPGSKERSAKSDDCEFMQFTGIIDKNGKEIYEGDIVKSYKTFVVEWEEDEDIDYGYIGFNLNRHYQDRYEVIGNIYENPELLKS